MSEKKTISINPDLFKCNGGKTRKKNPDGTGAKEIKIKNALSKPNKTTKGKVLRYIREQQEKNFKELFNNTVSKNSKIETALKSPLDESSSSEFENSVNYMKSIIEEEDKKVTNNSNNTTIKNKPISDSSFFQSIISEHVSKKYPQQDGFKTFQSDNVIDQINTNNNSSDTFQLAPRVYLPKPQYGCLKNGNLPTYRTFLNQTLKNKSKESEIPNISIVNTNPSNYSAPPVFSQQITSTLATNQNTNPLNIEERNRNEKLKNISEMKQLRELMKKKISTVPKNMKYIKQRKTVKRTYYLGKSKVFPKVAVLVSNKTLRKKITTQAQLLKQVPIQDVKKYLMQKGFIKVGSVAPNDVLRKMYESAVLVGGEIQNHNSDNFLYNYFNA
jgi:hypothetical protein